MGLTSRISTPDRACHMAGVQLGPAPCGKQLPPWHARSTAKGERQQPTGSGGAFPPYRSGGLSSHIGAGPPLPLSQGTTP